MPLDPQAAAFLKESEEKGAAPIEAMSPAEARRMMEATTEDLGEPEPVAYVEDCPIPGPAGQIPLRVYSPEGTGPFAAIVYFHGGGWVVGSLATHDGLCRRLTNATGRVVVSVDYRLAPEHKYPAGVEDAYAAIGWLSANAEQFEARGDRVAVAGDSAGGNLAAAATLMARDRGGPAIEHQVLLYPITDHNFETASYWRHADGFHLSRNAMMWFWNQYLASPEQASEPYAAPLQADDLSGLPPALVITAEFDPLLDEGEAYARRLAEAGTPAKCVRYDGMIHGFVRRTNRFDQAHQAVEAIAEALAGAQ